MYIAKNGHILTSLKGGNEVGRTCREGGGARVKVKGRYECVIPRDILIHNEKNILIPNNKEDCDVR